MVRLRGRRNQRSHVEFGVIRQRRLQSHIAPHVELGPPLADAVRLGSESQPVRQLRPKSAQSGEWRGLQRSHPLWRAERHVLRRVDQQHDDNPNGDYKEFAPRVGVAWSPREKWSIRASYGIFDAPRDENTV